MTTGTTGNAPAVAEQRRLAAIARYGVVEAVRDDSVIAALTALCELAVEITGAPSAVVNILDDRMQHQVAAYGCDAAACRLDESMCATTLAGGVDVCLADASSDDRFADSPWVDGRFAAIRMYCSTLLVNPQGHRLGTLCVFDEQPRQLEPHQVRALHLLAAQVVDQLELGLRSRELERSHAELAVSQDRLAAFAGQVSHDLKAPITAILGFAELLGELDDVAADPVAVGYLARCAGSAQRMLATIDDLLAFARIGGGVTRAPMSLDELMPEVLDDLGVHDGEASVSWAGPPVTADRAQLRALLQNLVANAIAYRRPEAAPVVRVTTARTGGEAVLAVADNGSGIPPERRADVLRPLVRLRHDVGGTGLGLAVAARVAAAHGGRLEIGDGPDGTGTTVSVTLPQD